VVFERNTVCKLTGRTQSRQKPLPIGTTHETTASGMILVNYDAPSFATKPFWLQRYGPVPEQALDWVKNHFLNFEVLVLRRKQAGNTRVTNRASSLLSQLPSTQIYKDFMPFFRPPNPSPALIQCGYHRKDERDKTPVGPLSLDPLAHTTTARRPSYPHPRRQIPIWFLSGSKQSTRNPQ